MSGVKVDDMDFKWGKQRGRGGKKNDVQFYESFTYDGVEYFLYDSVYLFKDGDVEPYIGKLIKIWEAANKIKRVKVLWFFRPSDISSYLSNESTKENELFLATGNGTGLTNVNLLEVISGKCAVVCTSKDERNRQPSTEEYENAEYIFYRTFDVEKCTISDKLGEKIAGIEVRSLLNTKNPEKSIVSKLDYCGEKDGASVDKLPISREMVLVDEGILKRGPNVKSSLGTHDDTGGADGCEKASFGAEVNKLSCQNRPEALSLKRDSSGEVRRCARDDGELRGDSCQVDKLDNGIKSFDDKSICDVDNVANIKQQQEIAKGSGLPAKCGVNLSNERPSKKLKPNSAKHPPNVPCKSSSPSVRASPSIKDVKASSPASTVAGSTKDVKTLLPTATVGGSTNDVNTSFGSTKDGKSSLGSTKDIKTSSHAAIATGSTKDVKTSSHAAIAAGITKEFTITLPAGGVAGSTKDVETPLLPTTATESTKHVKTSSSAATPIGNRDKMSRDSLVANNGSQELTPRVRMAKNSNEKLHRTPTNKETQAYGQVMEVTRRPNSMAEKGKNMSIVTPNTIRVSKRTITASARARVATERHILARGAHNTHVPPPEPQDDYDVGVGDYDVPMGDTTPKASFSSASTEAWTLDGPTGGGPTDHTLLTCFRGHVAYAIWNNPEESRDPLRIQSRVTKLRALPRDDADMGHAFDFIERTGLRYLRDTYFSHHNAPLISAFVERWHPETNSFHLPFGEMTITLHDVIHILGLSCTGEECTSPDFAEDRDVIPLVGELFEDKEQLVKGAFMKANSIGLEDILYKLTEDRVASDYCYAVLYVWYMLSCTLFVDKSGNRAPLSVLRLVANFDRLGNMALGAGTLANLYRNLGIASRRDCRQLGGCVTLLEAWIYEYFPAFRRSLSQSYQRGVHPTAMRWSTTRQTCPVDSRDHLVEYRMCLDSMTAEAVNFLPFEQDPASSFPISTYQGGLHFMDIVEPYMPDRATRQFGYVQVVPKTPIQPARGFCRSHKPKKYKADYKSCGFLWGYTHFHQIAFADALPRAIYPGDTSASYLQWYLNVSHPYIQPRGSEERPSIPNLDYMRTDTEVKQELMGGMRYWFKEHKRGVEKDICWQGMKELYFSMGGLALTSGEEEEVEQTIDDNGAGGS